MKIALIYLGRRGSGGVISLGLGRALAGKAQVAAFLSTGLETLDAWKSTQPFSVQARPTYSGTLEAAWTLVSQARIRRLASLVAAWHPDVLLFPMFHPWNAALQIMLSLFTVKDADKTSPHNTAIRPRLIEKMQVETFGKRVDFFDGLMKWLRLQPLHNLHL